MSNEVENAIMRNLVDGEDGIATGDVFLAVRDEALARDESFAVSDFNRAVVQLEKAGMLVLCNNVQPTVLTITEAGMKFRERLNAPELEPTLSQDLRTAERVEHAIMDILQDGPRMGVTVVKELKELHGANAKLVSEVSADMVQRGLLVKTNRW